MSSLTIRFKDYPNGCMLAELYNIADDRTKQIAFYHAAENRMTLNRCLCKGKVNTHCPSLTFFIWRVLWIFEDVITDNKYIHIYRDKLFNSETLIRDVQVMLDVLADNFADFGF